MEALRSQGTGRVPAAHRTGVTSPPGLGAGLEDVAGRAATCQVPRSHLPRLPWQMQLHRMAENRTVSRATANPSMHSTQKTGPLCNRSLAVTAIVFNFQTSSK